MDEKKYPWRCRKFGHKIISYFGENRMGLKCSRRGCSHEVDMTKPPFPSEPVEFLWAHEAES
jgi:hypothetical protein